jgi:hypothetical protein
LKKNMALRLAATSDDRALVIRDHLLPIVRERGTLEVQQGAVRVITLQISGWRFVHWTPFNELSLLEASSPGYRHAVERQHTRPDLPYGLDVFWREAKVLSIQWADGGAFALLHFERGSWEDAALALGQPAENEQPANEA